jgi:hypothetical protein
MASSGDSNSFKPFEIDEIEIRGVTPEDSRFQQEIAIRYRAVAPEDAALFFCQFPATYEELKAKRGPWGERFTL